MKRGLRLVVVLLLLLGAGTAVLEGWLALRSVDTPMNVAAPMRLEVPAGWRLARVAADLGARGILARPRAWVWYARWKGTAKVIKAGEYAIDPGMTPRQLLERIASGQVLLHSLTVVDGWRVSDMLAAMRRDPNIVMTLPAANPAILEKLGTPGENDEGQFLPETYRFPKGTTDLALLREAHVALKRVLDAAWRTHDPAIPLHDAHELLIMASIVEKESGVPEELPKIAGLYLHRLGMGMRLQADPTVIYGLGDAYDGDLHTVDLRTDGPYNTYTRTGLPPTPIALPGAAAIAATAHPMRTDALYFVASPKGDGSHVFSATLEEHNLAVQKYVMRQRQRAAGATR